MADFPALPLWTDAYLADTTHLTREEHGVYLLMLMAAWRSPQCRLPDNDEFLARVSKCSGKAWARLRPIIAPFWTIEGGFWTQKRLAKERMFCDDRREKRRTAAYAKHRKNKETTGADAGANAQHPHPHPSASKDAVVPPIAPQGAEPTATPSRRTVRKASQWPQGFELTPQRREYAERKVPGVDVSALWEGFETSAKAKGRMYADWDRAWQNWVVSPYAKPMLNGQRHAAPSKRSWIDATRDFLEEVHREPDDFEPGTHRSLPWAH